MQLKLFRGKWCVYWRENKQSRRHSLHTADKQEAERNFRDFLLALERPAETIADIFASYQKQKNHGAEIPWRVLKPYWGALRPDHVNRESCKAYTKARTDTGVKGNTVARELRILRAALRWHDPNTKAVFQIPPEGKPRDRRLTHDECAKLIAAAKTPHVRLFIILALTTAGRASAITELTWDRVDFTKGIITLQAGIATSTKGRATVPMNDTARAALMEAAQMRTCDHVIEFNRAPIQKVIISVKRTATRAGLKGVSPHVLRHTAACLMAEAGTPMDEIAQYLGHSNTATTYKVYARYSPTYLRRAASALEFKEMLGGTVEP